jgi:RNA polymerase sigma-70 factor (ECF subfamily)
MTLEPGRIYAEHSEAVWRFLHRLGARGTTLEDLTHDTFLMAYRRIETFDASRPLRPWLFGIAARVASDFRALARHRREVLQEDEALQAVSDDAGLGPEQSAQQRESKDIVAAALLALPMELRTVFVMHELEERPIPEVAEAMGTPVPTAYTRLRAARQRFTAAVESLTGRQS